MAFDAHANFAYSTVLTAPSPALSGVTIVLQSGDGAKFPAVPFNATVWPAGAIPLASNAELVRVTAKATDTLTVTRTTETGGGNRAIVVGDQIAATITKKTLTDIEALTVTGSVTSSATGNQNGAWFTLPSNLIVVLTMTNASLATIQSIPAGYDKQQLTIISQGAGQVDLSHLDASGTASQKLFNFATSGKTSLSGASGVATLVYDLANTRWALIHHEQGAWITPTFAAGNYLGNVSLTWTVASATTQRYMLRGRTLCVQAVISGTGGGTTNTQLIISNTAWGGFTAAAQFLAPMIYNDNAAGNLAGFSFTTAGGTQWIWEKLTVGNWTVAGATLAVSGQLVLEVN